MKKVFEAHAHYLFDIPLDETVDLFRREFEETGTYKCSFLSIPQESYDGKTLTFLELQNEKGLFLKHEFAPNGYAFAGLVHPKDMIYDEKTADDFLAQVKAYDKMGYDGIKMLEGYPQFRKANRTPLDDKVYDKFYAYLEEKQIPIIMHVANPDENWDESKVSEYAKSVGRFCDEETPSKKQLQNEVEGIMKKFPKLRLALAHFGFLTTDREAMETFMSYENTMMDITPGGEQYFKMLEDWDYWHEFLVKYQDRIFYGSDFYAFPYSTEEEWRTCFERRPKFLRQFFETADEHIYGEDKFRGVKLEEDLLDKIYYKNSERILGEPKKIDYKAFRVRCESLIKDNSVTEKGKKDLQYVLNNI